METTISRAEHLIALVESSSAMVEANPRVFCDLEATGLQQALDFFRHRFIPEVRGKYSLPLAVLICGGTNTGKSTLVNSFCRRIVSPTGGGVASTTKRVIAVGPAGRVSACVDARSDWQLRPYSLIQSVENPFLTLYQQTLDELPDGLPILLDTPDIDSSDITCRRHSLAALAFPDLVVWVTTQQKYKDRSGMTFLDDAMMVVRARLDVFNQFLPRQTEAYEDLCEFYRHRWPEAEVIPVVIPESPNLGEDGFLPESVLKPVKEAIGTFLSDPPARKIDNLRHGFRHIGKRLVRDARRIAGRRRECLSLRQELNSHFDETLFSPLQHLEGHFQPFELQAAMVRALQPRLENRFSTLVNQVDSSVRSLAGWAFGFLTARESRPALTMNDPVEVRDRRDRERLVKILEESRFEVIEHIRREAAAGHLLYSRLHSELRTFAWPELLSSPRLLGEAFDRRYREKMVPLVEMFERDLELFCRENPTLLNALRATVPGVSVLAGLAAAVFSIQVFTILPGVSEYLLGGVAFPIFRRMQEALPGRLVTLANELSHKPFITRARDEFAQARGAIFREFGRALSEPVLGLMSLTETGDLEVSSALKRLERTWERTLSERVPVPEIVDGNGDGDGDPEEDDR